MTLLFFFDSGVKDAATIDRLSRIGNNASVYSDAHLHLVDLFERDPGFASLVPGPDWRGAVVSHDIGEFARSEVLRAELPPTIAGFGIHPQGIRSDTADFLSALAAEGRIGFIGEAGFDFFGDRPERVRNDENLARQRQAFEFQLSLAIGKGLPLLVHSRKAMDILLGYGPAMKRLPALIFHGWPGRAQDALAFLGKGVPAYFSFGTTLLRSAKHAIETCRAIPEDRILSETDAPWQPPAGATWSRPDLIIAVADTLAAIRKVDPASMRQLLRSNFDEAFRLKRKGNG